MDRIKWVSILLTTKQSASYILTADSKNVLFHYRKYGVLGLYKGLEAKLLQTVLTAALMFVVYEKITAATFRVMGLQKKLKAWARPGLNAVLL